ncbi:polyphosphate polymerase domain-containing protein [Clostridium sp. D2Q-11]|uniref:Polyphosphate polymerase domain-containing protein n=1 Tax=Anaeromonas frigoriresistens TaxID=2683708 RepID=A0A942UZY4_9FIRM|nr:polyphosphate polymerase domain-containing protein [Anaeromonas frigoriresistens]MBS4539371.1 polyphosphate polymerase domain-containing protein [Anaeromonas frigoriresistens]
MKKQDNLFRHEIKYFINQIQAAELRLFLQQNMDLDPNCDETGSYWIRSLYFDTIDNKDYYEKIIGHNIRKKIRLRLYDIDSPSIKLEIKNKYDSYILKETVTMSRKDVHKLINGDSSPLLNYNKATAKKVFSFMHRDLYLPKIIIDYDREAYIYPFENIRVTLDKNLAASFHSHDFFKDNKSMIPIFNSPILILEVKYNHIIPIFFQNLLSNFEIQRSEISKYCLGRDILKR